MLCLSEWTPTPTIVMWFFSAVVEYMLVEIESCHWREVTPFALIWMAFVKNVFWCAFLEWLPVDMHNRIVCTCVASPHCEWACVVPGAQPHQMNLHILHICELSPQCGWPCASSIGVLDWMSSTLVYSFSLVWLVALDTVVFTVERKPWTNHPYREAQGLVRKRVGHWTILRAVETPVPESKSNPIQSNPGT